MSAHKRPAGTTICRTHKEVDQALNDERSFVIAGDVKKFHMPAGRSPCEKKRILEALRGHPSITHIRFTARHAEEWPDLFPTFESMPVLQSVHLTGLRFDGKALFPFHMFVGNDMKLRSLHLQDVYGDVNMWDATAAIACARNLESLCIHNWRNSQSPKKLGAAQRFLGSLRKLALSNVQVEDTMLRDILGLVKETGTLKHLEINGIEISLDTLQLLEEIVSKDFLTTLCLCEVGLLQRAAVRLAKCVRKSQISKFCLNRNMIGGEGVSRILSCFQDSPTLKFLALDAVSDVAITPESHLETFLKENRSIVELHLAHNGFTSEHAAAIAKGMMSNPTLQKHTLHQNRIGREGMDALLEAAKACPGLTELSLHSNSVIPRDLAALMKERAAMQPPPSVPPSSASSTPRSTRSVEEILYGGAPSRHGRR